MCEGPSPPIARDGQPIIICTSPLFFKIKQIHKPIIYFVDIKQAGFSNLKRRMDNISKFYNLSLISFSIYERLNLN